jgi:hypothetical protein
MSRCRISCGEYHNGKNYIEVVMFLSYNTITIAFDFTNNRSPYFTIMNYGYISIDKDVIDYNTVINAFKNTDDNYNNIPNYNNEIINNYQLYIRYNYTNIELRILNYETHAPPFFFDIVECDKEHYYDFFIETLIQMK